MRGKKDQQYKQEMHAERKKKVSTTSKRIETKNSGEN